MRRPLLITLLTLCFCNIIFAQEPKLMLPIGHTEEISAAHFSPDGKKIVTLSADKTAKIWDAETGRLLADLKGHADKVNVAVFSPDGKKIVTAAGIIAKVWNIETGKHDTDLSGHKDEIVSVHFSPDGNKIITASTDNTARIWNTKTWKTDTLLAEHAASVKSAEFSPDGEKILTASLDSTAKIWDAKTFSVITTLQGHTSGLQFAHFSADGKKILTASVSKKDSIKTKIWDAGNGKLITDLKGDTSLIWSAYFSPDGKKIITASQDQTAKIWDAETGQPDTVYEHEDAVVSARYNQDGKKFVTVSGDTAKIWDAVAGKLIADLSDHTAPVKSAEFSPDGKKIVTASADNTAKVWDGSSGKLIADMKGHTSAVKLACYSPDSKKIITVSSDSAARIWDAATGKLIANLFGVSYQSVRFSSDGKKIVTSSYDNTVKVWDAGSGMPDTVLTGNLATVNEAVFSPDSNKIIIASVDKKPKIRIWDFEAGQYDSLIGHREEVNSVAFNSDGTKMVTASSDKTAIIWDIKTKQRIKKLEGHILKINTAAFSPDGEKIITASLDNTIRIWDAETGSYDSIFVKGPNGVKSACYSLDGEKILAVNVKFVTIWNAATGELIAELKEENTIFNSARFSPDSAGKKIVTTSENDTAKIWDAKTGKVDAFLTGHEAVVNTAEFSPDGKNIVTASDDNTVKVWDTQTGKPLFTFFAVDSIDYLNYDAAYHYDGSDTARRLLYFICGNEVIGLNQLKDPLWVPGLAEIIRNGDPVIAKSLNELKICGLAPEVEYAGADSAGYKFLIYPLRGGLGETSFSINGVMNSTYEPGELIKHADSYELKIKKNKLNKFLSDGIKNNISVKAYTSDPDNPVCSDEVAVSIDKTGPPAAQAKLYAVMVGVSDYKDTELDLKYAAIDARDISDIIAHAAKKLLGKEQVVMYNLTTAKGSYSWPEKKNIKQVLAKIGKAATANDILLIFLSGHGVMEGKNKQFYFLTAEASETSAIKAFARVGISTAELSEWIRPDSIRAQKRILILDACNSGQAINDIADRGLSSQKIKAIDKLNEKSGLFILSASAPNQSAYESEKYEHGYLTYSLLKAIKQQPDILEDGKNLNINRWFNAAGKTVSDLAKENGSSQKPQVITMNNINIGVVDAEVMNKIKLAEEEFLFTASNFQNNDTIDADDNLNVSKAINEALKEISSGETDSKIVYAPNSESAEAFSLSGRYYITGNAITIRVIIKKNNEKIFRFVESGTNETVKDMSKAVVAKAIEWITDNNNQ